MQCPNCNLEHSDEFSFCPHCGAKVAVAQDVETMQGNAAAVGTIIGNDAQAGGERHCGDDVGGDKVAGDKVGGDKINIVINPQPVEPQPPAVDADSALARYLRHIVETNRQLQLQGIRSASGLVSIDLEEIYVTLATTVQRTTHEARLEEQAQPGPGEGQRLGPDRTREMSEQVKVQVQEALAMYPRLVVLGDPGCGKTTLLRYLALTYARDFAEQGEGLVEKRLQLKEHRLPILLPLRDMARYLEDNFPNPGTDGPKLMLDYLRTYFAHQDIALPKRFFADRLQEGGCVILLDGVDEVADFATRQRVARLVESFTRAYSDNRYVVTSRIVGYTSGARLGVDYAVTTVRDFTDADIERFVRYWNLAVEKVRTSDASKDHIQQEAKRQSEILLKAIRNNERVRELAVNPLLLTVIALVQRYRARLPERRVELYEEAVEVLLVKWDAVKGLSSTAALQGLELDAGDRRSMLGPIALWMMEQRAREIEVEDLRKQLGPVFHDLTQDSRRASKAIDGFLQLINERSGLLTERGQGVYAFSHLTFQEHLAARGVADRKDCIAYTLARVGDGWWREVILLEAGYLSTQGRQRATELIQAIIDCEEEAEPYHNLVLGAEALCDVGQARVSGNLGGQIQQRLRKAFEEPLRRSRDLSEAVRRRSVAAEALAKIESGLPGTQPGFWHLPGGEPAWVEIPAGEFWMGTGTDAHRVHLDVFQIARVPITNAQYRFFVEATGHRPPEHWEEGRPPKGKEGNPVVYVNWYDAMAYCAWLSNVTGKPVTLPSEAEWEKAARGTDRREYPWGNNWDATKCNAYELGLRNTTPVGIFPDGVSPYGCLDMAGNVWEWTRSLKRPYPYKADDGREDLSRRSTHRVLRGGSWYDSQDWARATCRTIGRTDTDLTSGYGFRVVVSHVPRSAS